MKVTKELRALSREDLLARAEEFKKELLKLKAQSTGGAGAQNPAAIRKAKRNIARVKTLLNEVSKK